MSDLAVEHLDLLVINTTAVCQYAFYHDCDHSRQVMPLHYIDMIFV
jgi:hypothetical protein